jgi:hypothetical protein
MSCLFQSLSAFIQGTDAATLRHLLADYLAKNPVLYDTEKISDIVQWEEGRPTLEQYVSRMRLQSTWGGAIEIKAFCDLFKAEVSVLVLRDQKMVEFKPSSSSDSASSPAFCFTISWNGFHYEPVFPQTT